MFLTCHLKMYPSEASYMWVCFIFLFCRNIYYLGEKSHLFYSWVKSKLKSVPISQGTQLTNKQKCTNMITKNMADNSKRWFNWFCLINHGLKNPKIMRNGDIQCYSVRQEHSHSKGLDVVTGKGTNLASF